VLTTPNIGTPSAGVVTNLTGTATAVTVGTATHAVQLKTARTIAGTSFDGTGNIAIGALNSTNVGATTSAELAGVLSNESGTGVVAFTTSPVFTTPNLGTPSSGVVTNLTGTATAVTVGTATTAGTVTTAAQTAITSVGTLTALNVTGNVGIGTTAPTVPLDVVGAIRSSGTGNSYVGGNLGIGTTAPTAILSIPSLKATTGTRYLIIDSSGNVGSSTTAPSGT
jgi:hypothetical protein